MLNFYRYDASVRVYGKQHGEGEQIMVHVLGFAGSLRKNSYNAAALRAASELLPEGMTLEIFDISPIPLFNDDIRLAGFPQPVRDFRERITNADALLIATPEYNFSVPGVLKNALDWASRPDKDGFLPLEWKPIALMGATTGLFGTARAQMHLRSVFVYTNSFVVNKPQVLIARAQERFDEHGRLIDTASRGFIRDLLVSLADLTQRLKSHHSVTANA